MSPTNIHIIIGRNGVGKTTLLRSISTLLRVGRRRSLGRLTFVTEDGESSEDNGFANLITVAFSAFDEFDPVIVGTATGLKYTYVGLKKRVRLTSGRHEVRIRRHPTSVLTLLQVLSNACAARESRGGGRLCRSWKAIRSLQPYAWSGWQIYRRMNLRRLR